MFETDMQVYYLYDEFHINISFFDHQYQMTMIYAKKMSSLKPLFAISRHRTQNNILGDGSTSKDPHTYT